MRLRPGDVALLLWFPVVLAVAAATGRFEKLRSADERFVYNGMVLILLLVSCAYALQWLRLSARRLEQTLRRVTTHGALAPADLDFSGEVALGGRAAAFLRDVFPVCLAVGCYDTTGLLSDVVHGERTFDGLLAALDRWLFGVDVAVFLDRFQSPLLTELISLGYFSHLLMPAAVMLFLHLRAGRPRLVEAAQGFVLVLLIGYAGYVLLPAVGPASAQATLFARPIQGGVIEQLNAFLIETVRQPRDAFPSLHVGLSAYLLLVALRASRGFGLLVLPFALLNWAGTLYLRYHYVVDVLAGLLLAALVDAGLRRWAARRLDKHPAPAKDPLS